MFEKIEEIEEIADDNFETVETEWIPVYNWIDGEIHYMTEEEAERYRQTLV
jgi:hypothetical protein